MFRLLLLGVYVCVSSIGFGQYRSIYVGGGATPLHWSGQSDFGTKGLAYQVHAGYRQGFWGARMDYTWGATYAKDRFSQTTRTIELSGTYILRQMLFDRVQMYGRAGIAGWSTDFTTEGYPGVRDYELKIENAKGVGPLVAAGLRYELSPIIVSVEGQYKRLGTADFLAGGFEARPLSVDQFNIAVHITYPLPFTVAASLGEPTKCPTF